MNNYFSPHLSRFGWCREALPYQQRSSQAVGQGWKCGGAGIPGREENPPSLPSLLPPLPPSLLSLEEKQFLFVREHKGEERKGIVHQAQQSLGGFQQRMPQPVRRARRAEG